MKVLQINSVCGVGSTGRIATDIHHALIEQGHESFIAFGRGEAKNCDTAIRIGNDFDVYSHVALTRLFDKHGFGSVLSTKDFVKKVKKINPDIIHLHNIHGYYINIDELFKLLVELKKPVVWTLHDCWSFTGHCTYFEFENCKKWMTYCKECPQKRKYPKSFFIDNSTDNFNFKTSRINSLSNITFVTPSVWLKTIFQLSMIKSKDVITINNGINTRVFSPTKRNPNLLAALDGKFVILGIANVWDERKGLAYFLELSEMLRYDEIILLVGLKNNVIKNIPKNIIPMKRTDNVEQLAELYSSAHVFINPTLEDNFPTTNIEALCSGIPVITFNTGGSVEVINDFNGYVTEDKNVTSLRSSIDRVRSNYESNLINANKISFDAKGNYDISNMIESYLLLYNRKS